ncbi:MAG: 3-phosphoserine/phosphohydroxythreonine transaminase, partial [Planctomycetia bacterium]|nr:3-phosphoserine/phosphohydroxythreonine transaminase [Planctomycetia bacterium]
MFGAVVDRPSRLEARPGRCPQSKEWSVTERTPLVADDRVFNFSPGPAVLPVEVLEQARDEMLSLPGVGMSVLEISHRSPAFDHILEETLQGLRDLLGIGADYEVVFLQGGASLQFSMVPMNLLRGQSGAADYLITGTWGATGAKEARREGKVHVAWDGAASAHDRLPAAGEISLSPQPAYVHVTSNETIQGVQWKHDPDVGSAPLVSDCSSDFLSRPIAVAKHGLIYACAQKNAGIAGVTVVIVRKDLLARCSDELPTMLDYRTYVKNGSRPNTPPVFAVYVLGLVCRWIATSMGGLSGMARHNAAKAKVLYDVLDQSGGFYAGHARPDCRSDMNVTFRLPDESLEKKFVAGATGRGLVDLKGHRSVGGIRASIYNA